MRLRSVALAAVTCLGLLGLIGAGANGTFTMSTGSGGKVTVGAFTEPPAVSITYPVSSTTYGANWPGAVSGTAAGSSATAISEVEISIQQIGGSSLDRYRHVHGGLPQLSGGSRHHRLVPGAPSRRSDLSRQLPDRGSGDRLGGRHRHEPVGGLHLRLRFAHGSGHLPSRRRRHLRRQLGWRGQRDGLAPRRARGDRHRGVSLDRGHHHGQMVERDLVHRFGEVVRGSHRDDDLDAPLRRIQPCCRRLLPCRCRSRRQRRGARYRRGGQLHLLR